MATIADLPCPFRLRGSLPISRAVAAREVDSERDLTDRPRRVDFSRVVLTATFDLECERPGQQEEEDEEEEEEESADVREQQEEGKELSESSSEQSDKSSECSQEAAPSTLLADDQREGQCRLSAFDGEQEQEEASKTLVLFSPGDLHKSPTAGELAPDPDLGTLAAVTPQSERPQALGSQLDVSEPGTLSSIIKSETKPLCPVVTAVTSCPFTKVERTFLHIAEKTHLNIMSSSGQLLPHDHYEFFQPRETQNGGYSMEHGQPTAPSPTAPQGGEARVQNGVGTGEDSLERTPEPEPVGRVEPRHSPEAKTRQEGEGERSKTLTGDGSLSTATSSQRKSRIPVLMSEEDTGSDHSASVSFKTRLSQRRSRHLDLARALMNKRQCRLIHLSSLTSSSASSGEERRAASGSSPMTASEEDTNSDSSLNRAAKGSEAYSQPARPHQAGSSKSKIPRPITLGKASSVVSSPHSSIVKQPATHRVTVSHGSGLPGSVPDHDGWIKQQRVESFLSPGSLQVSVYSGRPGLLPCRSLSASPRIRTLSRTDSPSPCRRRRLNTALSGSSVRAPALSPVGASVHQSRARSQAPVTKGRPLAAGGQQAAR